MVAESGDRIAVGVDSKDGYVAVNGWKEVTDERKLRVLQISAADRSEDRDIH